MIDFYNHNSIFYRNKKPLSPQLNDLFDTKIITIKVRKINKKSNLIIKKFKRKMLNKKSIEKVQNKGFCKFSNISLS